MMRSIIRHSFFKRSLLTIIAIVLLFAVWRAAAWYIGAEIILPTPLQTGKELASLMATGNFWVAVGMSALRVLLGFIISMTAGLLVGVAAGYSDVFYRLVRPFLTVIRTIPAISIILLALIWFKTGLVPVFVSLLLGFPIITGNVIEGIRNVDKKLLEMANVYHIPVGKQLRHIYIPSVLPFFTAGASTAVGIAWKVVVTAEVLSQPVHALGTGLQIAKVQLETPRMFAWTITGIAFGALFESVFTLLTKLLRKRRVR